MSQFKIGFQTILKAKFSFKVTFLLETLKRNIGFNFFLNLFCKTFLTLADLDNATNPNRA